MGTNFEMRVYDRENKQQTRPGESLRDASIRRAREQAVKARVKPIGEPEVSRIDGGPAYGPGWSVMWPEFETLDELDGGDR